MEWFYGIGLFCFGLLVLLVWWERRQAAMELKAKEARQLHLKQLDDDLEEKTIRQLVDRRDD